MPAPSKKSKQRIVEEIADGESLLINKTWGKNEVNRKEKKMKPTAKLEKEEPDLRKRESRSTRRERQQYGGNRGIRARIEPEEETVAAYNVNEYF
jgi:hypothetical protein